jgi:hypothetical protein
MEQEIINFIDSNWVEETSVIFGMDDNQLKVILYQNETYELFFKKGKTGTWKKAESNYCSVEFGSGALSINCDIIKKIITNRNKLKTCNID